MRLLKAIVVLIILCVATGIGFVYLAPEQATSLALDVERKRSGLEKRKSTFRIISVTFIWKGKR